MNILYIAYSCAPFKGSEEKIGWNIPLKCAQSNPSTNVYVVTKKEYDIVIPKYLQEHPMPNIHFYFVDIPAIYKKIFKGYLYPGRQNIWSKKSISDCKKNM